MDTAKVDIKKLQLLNDRISQCIDALNQVRLSVHGLSHSTGTGAEGGAVGFGVQDPRLGAMSFPQATTPWTSGLTHSSLGYPIGGQIPFAQTGAGFGAPFGQVPFGTIPFGQNPFAQQAFGIQGGGLSHASLELEAYNRPVWADPFLAAKVAQTFPYARYSVPPVVSIY